MNSEVEVKKRLDGERMTGGVVVVLCDGDNCEEELSVPLLQEEVFARGDSFQLQKTKRVELEIVKRHWFLQGSLELCPKCKKESEKL